MPFAYEVDPTQNAVFVRASGRLTDQELLALSQKITSDPHYHRAIRFIRENAPVTRDEITPGGFRKAADILMFPLAVRSAGRPPAEPA